MASSTQRAPSVQGGPLRRYPSEIGTRCANERPSGSVEGSLAIAIPTPISQLDGYRFHNIPLIGFELFRDQPKIRLSISAVLCRIAHFVRKGAAGLNSDDLNSCTLAIASTRRRNTRSQGGQL
jgi:hypothetical protein